MSLHTLALHRGAGFRGDNVGPPERVLICSWARGVEELPPGPWAPPKYTMLGEKILMCIIREIMRRIESKNSPIKNHKD